MNRALYLEPLSNLKALMKRKNSPLTEYLKVILLARLVIEQENILDPKIKDHPYPSTKDLINETITMFNALMKIEKFEKSDGFGNNLYGKKMKLSKNLGPLSKTRRIS